MQNIPPVTRNLLIVNVIMFVATLINPVFMKGTFSMAFPISVRTSITMVSMRAKAMMCRTVPGRSAKDLSQSPKGTENLKDSQTPSTRAIRDIACETKPFENPWKSAGMQQTRIIMSMMFTC